MKTKFRRKAYSKNATTLYLEEKDKRNQQIELKKLCNLWSKSGIPKIHVRLNETNNRFLVPFNTYKEII